VDCSELERRLDVGEIVRLTRDDWNSCCQRYAVVEQHDTGLRGELLIVEHPTGLAVVEEPSPTERAIRPIASLADAHQLLTDRLATYDRMWDGCGCKIDYYR
jgi:hypothetical protein